MILAGDVGGTKCNLALFAERNGRLEPVFERRFASKDYAQFDLLVSDFARQAASYSSTDRVIAAGFGVAGPVTHNRVKATNLPWTVDGAVIAEKLGVEHAVLMNDLAATAHSLEYLAPEDFCVLNKGQAEPNATKGLIAAGTGLGHAILFWDGQRYQVAPSEGGHADFAPHDERQAQLLKFMLRRVQPVCVEAILSGRGFRAVHEFLDPAVRHPAFDDPDADPAPDITRRGLEKSCPVCVETLDLWTSIYGSETGNFALRMLAIAGVYVAGGIAVKILPKMKDGTFWRAFCHKSKLQYLLERIPLSIVLNEKAPLIGAAHQALKAARG